MILDGISSQKMAQVLKSGAYDCQVATRAEEIIYSSLPLDLSYPAMESDSPFLDHLP